MDFTAPRGLWNPLRKKVPCKFRGSGEHSKLNCLQDWANFHRIRAWQIVLIFNTTTINALLGQLVSNTSDCLHFNIRYTQNLHYNDIFVSDQSQKNTFLLHREYTISADIGNASIGLAASLKLTSLMGTYQLSEMWVQILTPLCEYQHEWNFSALQCYRKHVLWAMVFI